MARYGCLILAVVVATVLLFFIVYLWSGWLNRPVGHILPAIASVAVEAEAIIPAVGKCNNRILNANYAQFEEYKR